MRSPHTTTKSSPRSPQPEKARTQGRPNAAKNLKINKFIKKKKSYRTLFLENIQKVTDIMSSSQVLGGYHRLTVVQRPSH